MLDLVANFLMFMFAGTAGIGAALAVYLAFVEDWRRSNRLAFDFVRSIGIMLGGWFTVALAILLDPVRLGASAFVPPSVMAVATLLCFLSAAVGWTCFLVFQLQALRGRHPWQQHEGGWI